MKSKKNHPDPLSLAGKTIMVTGAGSDIGAAIAQGFAKKGGTVIMLDRVHKSMTDTYDAIVEAGYPEPLMLEFHIARAQPERFHALYEALAIELNQAPKNKTGELHGIVHAAMYGAPLTPMALASMHSWTEIYDQQVIRPMYLTRCLYPLLKSARQAKILFAYYAPETISKAYWGALAASSAALEGMVKVINDEWEADNILAVNIDCSDARTALRKQFYPAEINTNLIAPNDPKFIARFIQYFDQATK